MYGRENFESWGRRRRRDVHSDLADGLDVHNDLDVHSDLVKRSVGGRPATSLDDNTMSLRDV